MQGSLALSAVLILAVQLAVASSYEKKSGDLSEFASALNGAGRLRYGKRSMPFLDSFKEKMARGFDDDDSMAVFTFEKRAPSPDFVTSLNKAERLRFGRK